MPHTALLPHGLPDLLPPDAAHEAHLVEGLLALFAERGYERAKPPLAEFEETLLSGMGEDLADQSFRVMDPETRRMLAIRADFTPQIARLAATRLANAARPLRLSYGGQVLRIKGNQLRTERQFAQVGAELFGAQGPAADAEVVLMAAEALDAMGVRNLSVDLGIPSLIPALCAAHGLDPVTGGSLRHALDRKDAAAVRALGGGAAASCDALLRATGPAERALGLLQAMDLPAEAAQARDALVEVVIGLTADAPDLPLTIDPVENRGFEYHSGVTFTLFSRDVGSELGRGGRYRAHGTGEPATGFTLFMDTVLKAVPGPDIGQRRLFAPLGTAAATLRILRAAGWVTVSGLSDVTDTRGEARRLGCPFLLNAAGEPVPVGE
jgi:ATP phosphoribosyltransferase regulatory subunit